MYTHAWWTAWWTDKRIAEFFVLKDKGMQRKDLISEMKLDKKKYDAGLRKWNQINVTSTTPSKAKGKFLFLFFVFFSSNISFSCRCFCIFIEKKKKGSL